MEPEELKYGNSPWNLLSADRQKEILAACGDSEDEANLISLEEIKLKYEQWPLK